MQTNWLTSTAAAAAGAALTFAMATPVWASAPTSPQLSGKLSATLKSDPPGANGTVKIDGPEFGLGINNEPHVTCDFQVKFFNFDAGEHANIVFTVHPPTGSGVELLRRNNVLISNDAASGGKPDPDEVYTFSANDLGLARYEPHPQQGYHVKLTVERIGAPGAGKHKVFWIQPCTASTPSTPPGGGGVNGGGGGNGGGGEQPGGGLPLTGVPVAGIVGLGAVLVAGGAALLIARRRYAA